MDNIAAPFRVPAYAAPSILLDTLPIEIQDLIFHYVVLDSNPGELKRLRLSNRYFRDRADIYLFRTLHISASNLSLDRVRKVAENDRLRVHVQELVYHRGTFSGHKMSQYGLSLKARDYGDFEEYMVRGQAGFRPAQSDLMRVSQCYAAFCEELEAESNFNRELSWRMSMKKNCSRFPKLEHLTTQWAYEDLNSKYLRKRCGLTHQSATPNYFAPYEIFESCGPSFRPRVLSLEGVEGEDFAAIMTFIRGGVEAVKARFSELRYLKLSFSETVATLEVEGTYDVFIQACDNLRFLHLDFSSFTSLRLRKDPHCFPQRLIKIVLQRHFPRLSHLELKNAMMTELDLIGFVHHHSRTLQTLSLDDWSMPVTSEGQATGSFIRTLWKLGKLPLNKSRTITLNGSFSNNKDNSGWNITHANTGRPSVASRVHSFLSGAEGHDFPFNITAEQIEKATTSVQLVDLDMMPLRLGQKDNTFVWCTDAV
ncbi:hypothetical protein LTR51_004431 [Lithohypha guttulata]|nr:hypothetical protein LTR51_004431 [Lithohypha guttulata]